MKSTLVDAGPLIALFDAHDSHHSAVRRFLEDFRGRLFTTWPVLTEATHMLSFSVQSQANLLTWVRRNGVQLFPLAAAHLGRLIALLQKYSDLPLDLADGSLLVAAEHLGILDILTIDSDYSIYRMANGRALRNALRV